MTSKAAQSCIILLVVNSFAMLPALSSPNVGISPDIPEVKPYDCQVEADIWEWAWTPDWKAWCCQYESRGCPPTETMTATSTSSLTATSTATTPSTVVTSTQRTFPPSTSSTVSTSTELVTTSTEMAVSSTDVVTTSTEIVTTSTEVTTASMEVVQTTSAVEDLGCNSVCVILGESATCQARITWVEMHETNKESAPCPAAHVVVMSQCASCGSCLFKKVRCAHKHGISKKLGDDTFMYKFQEYKDAEQVPNLGARLRNVLIGTIAGVAIGSVVIGMLVGVRSVSFRRTGERDQFVNWGPNMASLNAEE